MRPSILLSRCLIRRTLIIVAAYLTFAAAVTAYTQYARHPSGADADAAAPEKGNRAADDPVPLWIYLLHALYAIALPGSCLVTVLFWLLVYPGDPGSAERAMSYFVHGARGHLRGKPR